MGDIERLILSLIGCVGLSLFIGAMVCLVSDANARRERRIAAVKTMLVNEAVRWCEKQIEAAINERDQRWLKRVLR